MLGKRFLSLIMAAAVSAGAIPVYAAQTSKRDIKARMAEIEAKASEEGVVLDEAVPYEFAPDSTQEPEEDIEENIHTETITGDIELQEESERLIDEPEVSLFSTGNDYSDLWKSLFSEYFGDDYLAPYKGNKDGQRVTGKTNRLVVEETDLSLPGKNGLDLNIRRKHDNQYYNHIYSRVRYDEIDNVYIDRYGYGFTNSNTNGNIYVLFTNEDDFYIYMKNGITISSLPSPFKNKSVNGTYYNLYLFEDIYSRKSTAGITLTYNSNMSEINDTEKDTGRYGLEDRKLLPKDNFLGDGWDLVMPSASLHRYLYETDTSGYPKIYEGEYIGAFRDIDGNVFSFEGNDKFKRYENSNTTYTSHFYCDDNKYFTLTSYYAAQSLYAGGPQYNFEIKDNRGIKYYFFNTGLEGRPSANQKMYIVAIQDEYGNTIRYEYGLEYVDGIVKIIDTYGREININHTLYNTVISYNDDNNTERQIVYHRETLPASTLNAGILKDKDVSRFSVTNAEGETTIYDSRYACVSNVIFTTSNYPINNVPTFINLTCESTSYNIERVIYPTGAETRYLYKRLYSLNTDAKVLNGLYGVESTYDVDGGTISNRKDYQFANTSTTLTKTITDVPKSAITIETYNKKGLLTKSITSATGTVSSSPYTSVTNTYDSYDNLTNQIVNNNGVSNTTDYTYNNYYPASVSSVTTDRSKITYTYHNVDGKLTNIPQVITYKYKSGSTYETDYSIENAINEQKSIVMTKKIKDNSIKSQTQYGYDSSGRTILTRQWDKDSNSDGVLDENDDTIDKVVSYVDTDVYSLGALVTVSDIYDYDGNEEDSLCELYNINVYGDLTKKDDTYRAITTVEYDALSRPTKYTYPNGAERTVVYNTAGKNATITDEAGTQYKNTYDGFGRLTHKHFFDGSIWKPLLRYSYDTAGRVAYCDKFRAPGQYTRETYTYDILDRVSTKQVYNGSSTLLYTENYSYAVQSGQQVITKTTTATDNASAATETEYYDKYGRLMKKQTSSGSTVIANEYTYDYKDNMLTETDARGNTTTYEYDDSNRMTSKTLPDEHIYTWTYDMLGRMIYSFDSAPFAYVWYQYDSMNREIYRRTPFGHDRTITKTYYDANSNVIRTLRQNNADDNTSEDSFAETFYTYDNMNNLIGETSNTGTRTEAVQYWYDDASRVIAMQTGLSSINPSSAVPTSGAVTKYEYDELGYVTKETDALGNFSMMENNYVGDAEWVDDRNGNYIVNTYGPYGILRSDQYGDMNDAEYYTYDNLGRITQRRTAGGSGTDTISYTYDAFGRVTAENGDGYTNEYTYDLNSNVASYTLKEGNTTKSSESYSYDEANHLTNQNINGKIITYSYSDGLMTQKNVDGISTHITYNDALLPTGYTTSKNNTTYSSYTYTYRLDGNRIGETDSVNNRTRAYTYDNIGRLTGETISGDIDLNMTYAYDMRGNRTSKTVTGDENYTVASTYDNNNRLTKQTKSVGGSQTDSTQYYYDNNGNQTFKQHFTYSTGELMSMSVGTESDDVESFTYNARNQLTGYTKGSTNASYTYGANGLRKSKTVGSSTTGFVWNGNNLAAEKTSGSIKNIYSYGTDGIAISNIGGTLSFYLKDAHGNVVGTTNANGVQNSSYTYDAFGNNLSAPASTDTNPFRYCGAYYDNESGNIYLRARYYDTASGRFISEDPIKDGLNWYSYCGGNPVGFVDPSGLEYIVVSASEYDGLITRRYKYNFIEPAIKKVKDLKGLKDGQWITWIISKTGYSDEDLQNFNDIAYEMGVGIQFIDSAAQLQNYINSQDINTWQLSSSRTDDPIKKFVVFSHGVVGSIELGYKQSNPGILSLNYNWIQGICSEAFNNPNTAFYSCNTGTDRDTKWGNNFAQNWVDRVSGRTWASVGKTDYAGILGVRSEEEENLAKKYGFNTKGAHNFPTTSGQWVNYFRRQY